MECRQDSLAKRGTKEARNKAMCMAAGKECGAKGTVGAKAESQV